MGEVLAFRRRSGASVMCVRLSPLANGDIGVTYAMSNGRRHTKPAGPEDVPHIEAARAAGSLEVVPDDAPREEGRPGP
jgi:hypothetical protein